MELARALLVFLLKAMGAEAGSMSTFAALAIAVLGDIARAAMNGSSPTSSVEPLQGRCGLISAYLAQLYRFRGHKVPRLCGEGGKVPYLARHRS
jgi:hypothetical protein